MDITIYDNLGESLDRYTIVDNSSGKPIAGHKRKKLYDCISSSETGLGVFMWSQCQKGAHLGKIVSLESLDEGLQKSIIREFSSQE